MAGGKEIDSLELRKQALILESNLNRLVLQAEWEKLHAATAWIGTTASAWDTVKPWLTTLAPLGGFLTARQGCQGKGILRQILSAVKWLRMGWSLWQSVSSHRASSDPKEKRED